MLKDLMPKRICASSMLSGLSKVLGGVAKETGSTVTGLVGGGFGVVMLLVASIILSVWYQSAWFVVGTLIAVGALFFGTQCLLNSKSTRVSRAGGIDSSSDTLPTLALRVEGEYY
jgi:hypothetical protein